MAATRPSCGSSSAGTTRCRRTSGKCRRSRGDSRRASSSCGARGARLRRRPSQLRANVPQLRVEALAQGAAQVLRAAAPAGAGLRADLSLHHQHVTRAPVGERLVVVEQRFAEVEEVAVALAVSEDFEQGGRPTPREQAVKSVIQRRLVEAPAQPARLSGGSPPAGPDTSVPSARQELDLTELHRLEPAGRRELRAESQEILR